MSLLGVRDHPMVESELNRLQQRLETNVKAMDSLLHNYTNELAKLQVHKQKESIIQSLTGLKNGTFITSNSRAPKPPPKPVKVRGSQSKTPFSKCSNEYKVDMRAGLYGAPHTEFPDYKEVIQQSYSRLINYISCTDDIAARLYQSQMLTRSELESIHETRNMVKATEILLNLLLQKSDEVYQSFLSELQRTRQNHVISILTNVGNESTDHLHHCKIIRQHYVYLTETIEVEGSGLLNQLVAGNVLTDRERADIATEWNKYRQVECLLGIIERKSSDSFSRFLEALENSNQTHVSDTLQKRPETGHFKHQEKTQDVKSASGIQPKTCTENEDVEPNVKRLKKRSKLLIGHRSPSSVQLDISIKVLVLRRCSNELHSSRSDDCHIDAVLKGFFETRKSMYNMEREKAESLDRNAALSAEIDGSYFRLRNTEEEVERLHSELNKAKFENYQLKLQERALIIGRDQLELQLREINAANERLNQKLIDAVNVINRKQESVLESVEFMRLKKNKDRIEIQLKETETEFKKQNCRFLDQERNNAEQSKQLEIVREELSRETELRLSLTKQSQKDKITIETLKNDISSLKHSVHQLEDEKHRLINDLNLEREKNSGSMTPRFHATHVDQLKIPATWIEGVATLDEKLYLACRGSSTIAVYTNQAPHVRQYSIQVPGMTGPIDIVACSKHRCLYITDLGNTCVWRVKTDGKSDKWLASTTWPYTLSVTKDGRVLIIRRPSNLDIYGPESNLIDSIRLPNCILDPCHAVETATGTFLVSHGEQLPQRHGVTEISKDGHIIRSYGGRPGNGITDLDRPRYLGLDDEGNVLVADYGNNRVIMLNSKLKFVEIVLKKENNVLKNPLRIYLCADKTSVVVVNNGLVDTYTLTEPQTMDHVTC